MPSKNYITPETKVGLKLTAKERKLILDLMCLDDEYEGIVRATPVREPISLTLDQWDDFCCYIAAEAKHTEDKGFQKKLHAIFEKVETILETYSDEKPEVKVAGPEMTMTLAKLARLLGWQPDFRIQESGHSATPTRTP